MLTRFPNGVESFGVPVRGIVGAVGSTSAQSLTSDSTLVPITGLEVELAANTAYQIEFFAGVGNSALNVGISTLFVFDGTFSSVAIGGLTSSAGVGVFAAIYSNELTTEQGYNLADNDFNWVRNFGTINVTTGGVLSIEARQLLAGDPTTILPGSASLVATPFAEL